MHRFLAPAAAALVLLTACASTSRPAASPPRPEPVTTTTTTAPNPQPKTAATAKPVAPRPAVLMALGDSVPAGTMCKCTPFPNLSAADVTRRDGRPVATVNDAVPGFESGDVLKQLDDDDDVIAHARTADFVLIEVGANDVQYSNACGTNAKCYEAQLPAVTANLQAIVSRVKAIATHPVSVVLLDYWSAWLGGQYEKAQGTAYVAAADAVTDALNAAIGIVARKQGAIDVDLRTAFRGTDESQDETPLLASDGDHPNAAGHRRIAAAIAAAGALSA